jgi:hypothetical protein
MYMIPRARKPARAREMSGALFAARRPVVPRPVVLRPVVRLPVLRLPVLRLASRCARAATS